MNRIKSIEEILFWAELRHQNKIDAIRLGVFGKTEEEIKKNLAKFKRLEEKVVNTEIKEIDKVVHRKRNKP